MLNYAETARASTDVPFSPVLHLVDEQKTAPLTSPMNLDGYVFLHIGGNTVGLVTPTLKDGYLTARKAFAEMAEQDEYGPFLFLTGYQYAHLARQHLPAGLTPAQKGDWQRGFIMGWVACVFYL